MNKKIFVTTALAGALSLSGAFAQENGSNVTTDYQSLDDVERRIKSVLPLALAGYMKTHDLEPHDLHEGFQVPWMKHNSWREYWGTIVATGNISDNGCVVADVLSSTQWVNGTIDSERYSDIEICIPD